MPATTDITLSEGKHGTRNVVTLPLEGDGVFIGSWAVRQTSGSSAHLLPLPRFCCSHR